MQRGDGSRDRRIARGPIIAAAREQSHASDIAPCHQPKPVVLDLMNPVRPGGGLRRWAGQAWLYEAVQVGTGPYRNIAHLIPSPSDQNPCAQSRSPIDMILQG